MVNHQQLQGTIAMLAVLLMATTAAALVAFKIMKYAEKMIEK